MSQGKRLVLTINHFKGYSFFNFLNKSSPYIWKSQGYLPLWF